MKIYVNGRHEIKALEGEPIPEGLAEIEVDRAEAFPGYSDMRIKCYCYERMENGYAVYPAIPIEQVDALDKQVRAETRSLQQQITELDLANIEAQQQITDYDLQSLAAGK